MSVESVVYTYRHVSSDWAVQWQLTCRYSLRWIVTCQQRQRCILSCQQRLRWIVMCQHRLRAIVTRQHRLRGTATCQHRLRGRNSDMSAETELYISFLYILYIYASCILTALVGALLWKRFHNIPDLYIIEFVLLFFYYKVQSPDLLLCLTGYTITTTTTKKTSRLSHINSSIGMGTYFFTSFLNDAHHSFASTPKARSESMHWPASCRTSTVWPYLV